MPSEEEGRGRETVIGALFGTGGPSKRKLEGREALSAKKRGIRGLEDRVIPQPRSHDVPAKSWPARQTGRGKKTGEGQGKVRTVRRGRKLIKPLLRVHTKFRLPWKIASGIQKRGERSAKKHLSVVEAGFFFSSQKTFQ